VNQIGALIVNRCVFNHDDGVASSGDDGPGGDGDGGAGGDFTTSWIVPGGDPWQEDLEAYGFELDGAVCVPGFDCEAVDVAAVKARDIDRRSYIFGQSMTEQGVVEGMLYDSGFESFAQLIKSVMGGCFVDDIEELMLFHSGSPQGS
jgi:hypothetical protein